ncbi:hypothetical protein J4X02_12680, partial [Escherichia coli]
LFFFFSSRLALGVVLVPWARDSVKKTVFTVRNYLTSYRQKKTIQIWMAFHNSEELAALTNRFK